MGYLPLFKWMIRILSSYHPRIPIMVSWDIPHSTTWCHFVSFGAPHPGDSSCMRMYAAYFILTRHYEDIRRRWFSWLLPLSVGTYIVIRLYVIYPVSSYQRRQDNHYSKFMYRQHWSHSYQILPVYSIFSLLALQVYPLRWCICLVKTDHPLWSPHHQLYLVWHNVDIADWRSTDLRYHSGLPGNHSPSLGYWSQSYIETVCDKRSTCHLR